MTSIPKRIYRTGRRTARTLLEDLYEHRDAKRFRKALPELADYGQLTVPNISKLKPAYTEYTTEISHDGIAASLETSVFLYTLATIKQPKRILDLGSGFSSFTFRLYSMSTPNDVAVYSVDDNSDWLDRTRSFLTVHGVQADNLFDWSEFREINWSRFDLIFHDLGSMELRGESLPFVSGLVDHNGIIVLDDIHRRRYRRIAVQEVRKEGLTLISLRQHTLDSFGRFSGMAIRR